MTIIGDMIEIKHRNTSAVLLRSETAITIKQAISELLAAPPHQSWLRGEAGGVRANLAGANLAGANLAGADIEGANLARAYLADANLAGADLAGANLARAYLAGANLAGAYLEGADLEDHKDPTDPFVRGRKTSPAVLAERAAQYRARHPQVPVVENLDARILGAIESKAYVLDMSHWHGTDEEPCGTTHCRAGFAIHFAGAAGVALEREHGPATAGRMIYLASTGRAPHFFATNDRALEDIRQCAADPTGPPGEAVPS